MKIRSGRISDAEELRDLSERTFRETFAETNSVSDMEAYARDHFSLDGVHAELSGDAGSFLLAHSEGARTPVGYAKVRVGRAEQCVTGTDPMELERLYVSRHAIGSGVGAELMRAVLGKARDEQCQTLWLGVWEHNDRALEFYRRWGFVVVGSHIFRLGTDDQTDLIMARAVGESGVTSTDR
ncbi:MAG: GNAT family N-acetyltransferase [Gemmatimonadaceae bacterium]